ncbi:MAG: type II toxin-antitoxin system PemK/MazF family toxin [Vicinamibacterales bacterium]
MHPGDIYLARFPFSDGPGIKLRPVLLLTGTIGSVPEVLVAYLSSVVPDRPLPSDYVLDPAKTEFKSTHLKVVSVLRLHKLATLHRSSLARHLGALNPTQRPVIAAKLKALLEL